MKDPRPHLGKALDRLLPDMCTRIPELSHVSAPRVLVVAGGARENSRATIRPMSNVKVRVDGERRLYEITLRPLFFLDANGLGRLITLCHELFHIGDGCDGQLHPHRRHNAAEGDFDGRMEELARAYVRVAPPRLLGALAHDGEVIMRQWRVRPGVDDRKPFGDAHLFDGPVVMRTPKAERSVWW